MAKQIKRNAKRAVRPNPREDRNFSRPPRHQHPSTTQYFNDNDSAYSSPTTKKKAELLPRNLAQESYVDTLLDDSKDIVFAMGPAGCGKTLLATIYAIQGLQSGEFKKVIITRPTVAVGTDAIGFLPGGLIEKLAPWVIPIADIFKEHYGVPLFERMLTNEQVEIAALGMMRGRTLKDAVVIFDEAQNATVDQMKMVLTRIGDNCRMLVTGDLRQHDRGYEENGLKDFVGRLKAKGSERIAICEFGRGDVERHPVIEEVLSLYGDD